MHITCDIYQEQTSPLENFNEESNIFGNMNDEVNNKEKHIKLKNNEDNSNHLISQEATIQSTNPISDTTTLEDMNEKSRDSVDDKVNLIL